MNHPLFIFVFLINVAGTICAVKEFYFGIIGIDNSTGLNIQLIGSTSSNNISKSLVVESLNNTIYSGPVSDSFLLSLPNELAVLSSYNVLNRTNALHAYTDDELLSFVVLISSDVSSDAYLLYPHTTLSKPYTYYEYVVIAGSIEDSCISKVLLVSGMDYTEVIVYPTSNIEVPSDISINESIEAGSMLTIELHKFQTFLMSSNVGSLSGTIVISNQTLSVFSGYDCTTMVGYFGVEQMPFTAAWGRIFVIPKFNDAEQEITFAATQYQTTINVTDNTRSFTIELDRSNVSTVKSNGTLYCVSDTPILVTAMLLINKSKVFSVVPSIEQSPSILEFEKYSCCLTLFVSLSMVINDTLKVFLNEQDISNFNWSKFEFGDETVYNNYIKIVEDTSKQIVETSSGIVISSISYSTIGCIYAHPTCYEVTILQVANISFVQHGYEVSENEESVLVTIERFELLNVKTRFKLEVLSDAGHSFSINLSFDVWEFFKEVNITFIDDIYVESNEELTATILQQDEPINASPIKQARIRIIDNDSLNIGIVSIVFDNPIMMVTFGITKGNITSSLYINVTIELIVLSTNFSFNTILSSVVSTQMLYINLLNLDSVSSITNDTVFSTKLTLNSKNLSISVNPDIISDSLGNKTIDNISIPNYFIFSQFTAESLLITLCIIAVLIIVIVIIIFISVIVCLSFFRYGRQWSVTGTMNRFYLQDDAISLSTNDPDTYELMNRLGESTIDKLTINDDNAYT